MGKAIGVEIKAAIKKAATWGTAIACGANNGILILPANIKRTRSFIQDDSLGLYFPKEGDFAEIKAEGNIEAYLRYDSLDLLIALMQGSTGGAPVQQGLTTAYAQKFIMTDTLAGLLAVYCINNNINIDEFTSIKVSGCTIGGEVGQPIKISLDVIANDRKVDSAVNTITTFANVTYFETANRVIYSHGKIRMNAQSGAALADTDIIYPKSFELSFKRKLAGIYGIGGSFDKIDEPTNDGILETKLKLDFPRYTTNQNFLDWESQTEKKMEIIFTGGLIATPYYRTFKLSFPNLKLTDVDLPLSLGILNHPLEFECLSCDTAPTGMTGITKPFQIDVINRQSVNVLA